MDTSYFLMLARYNQWANRCLYEVCGQLGEEEYFKPRPSFFGSIHATLNHILVADRIWKSRIHGISSGIQALDQILYPHFSELKQAREKEDAEILAWVSKGIKERLPNLLHYKNMKGEERATPLSVVLGHLFNHQTHHRGQVHGLLSQTKLVPPVLDLVAYWHLHESLESV